MNIKLIAIGNVLMNDDGIGIEVAKELEEELLVKGIEVIYGETDVDYCISKISESDYIIILDAGTYGNDLGELTVIPLALFYTYKQTYNQHNISLLDILSFYYPKIDGEIIVIEVKEIKIYLGLSSVLNEKLETISEKIRKRIETIVSLKMT